LGHAKAPPSPTMTDAWKGFWIGDVVVAILVGWWHPWSAGTQLQQNASSADTTLLLADTNREGCVAAATSGPPVP
jgi:hypothetical protein